MTLVSLIFRHSAAARRDIAPVRHQLVVLQASAMDASIWSVNSRGSVSPNRSNRWPIGSQWTNQKLMHLSLPSLARMNLKERGLYDNIDLQVLISKFQNIYYFFCITQNIIFSERFCLLFIFTIFSNRIYTTHELKTKSFVHVAKCLRPNLPQNIWLGHWVDGLYAIIFPRIIFYKTGIHF